MITKLPKEFRRALNSSETLELEVVDPQTQRVYVICDAGMQSAYWIVKQLPKVFAKCKAARHNRRMRQLGKCAPNLDSNAANAVIPSSHYEARSA